MSIGVDDGGNRSFRKIHSMGAMIGEGTKNYFILSSASNHDD